MENPSLFVAIKKRRSPLRGTFVKTRYHPASLHRFTRGDSPAGCLPGPPANGGAPSGAHIFHRSRRKLQSHVHAAHRRRLALFRLAQGAHCGATLFFIASYISSVLYRRFSPLSSPLCALAGTILCSRAADKGAPEALFRADAAICRSASSVSELRAGAAFVPAGYRPARASVYAGLSCAALK